MQIHLVWFEKKYTKHFKYFRILAWILIINYTSDVNNYGPAALVTVGSKIKTIILLYWQSVLIQELLFGWSLHRCMSLLNIVINILGHNAVCTFFICGSKTFGIIKHIQCLENSTIEWLSNCIYVDYICNMLNSAVILWVMKGISFNCYLV